MKLPGNPPVVTKLMFDCLKAGYALGVDNLYDKIVSHYPHTNSVLSTLDKEKNDLLSRLNTISLEKFLSAMSSEGGDQE